MTGTASPTPVASRTVVTLSSIFAPLLSSAASAVVGKARRQSRATARIQYLARIFIASTPVLLGPADLLKAGGRFAASVSRGGTGERRSSLGSRSATAMCGFGNRAILTISRPLALRPCLTTGLPLSFEVGIGRSRAKVEHFVDRLADEVSPAWQHPQETGAQAQVPRRARAREASAPRRRDRKRRPRPARKATARAGVERPGTGGQPASLAAGGGQRATARVTPITTTRSRTFRDAPVAFPDHRVRTVRTPWPGDRIWFTTRSGRWGVPTCLGGRSRCRCRTALSSGPHESRVRARRDAGARRQKGGDG